MTGAAVLLAAGAGTAAAVAATGTAAAVAATGAVAGTGAVAVVLALLAAVRSLWSP